MIGFALLAFQAINSVDASCPTLWGGQTCMESSQVPNGFKGYFATGDPCFNYDGTNYACFTSVSGNSGSLGFCNPSVSGCSSGVGASSSSAASGNSGTTTTMTCDNSDLASSDCSSTKSTYCDIKSDHTMCEYCGTNTDMCNQVCSRGITAQADKDAIVAKHNELRRKVAKGQESRGVGGAQPSATNMYELKWNDELAEVAQRWADQCTWDHDEERGTSQFPYVGQNMAMSMSSAAPNNDRSYDSHIMGWYDEVKDFPPENVGGYSESGATGTIGHYTQVVWGSTTEVGCGYVAFKNENNEFNTPTMPYLQYLICNYGDGGNYQGSPLYNVGSTASECPNGSDDGLCKQ